MSVGPAINVPAYDVKGHRLRRVGSSEQMGHVELFPIQVEPAGGNEVKISIDGVSRIVDGFALGRAINEAIERYRRR